MDSAVLDAVVQQEQARLDAACLKQEWSLDEMIEREHSAGIELGPYHRAKLLKSASPRVLSLLEQGRLKPQLVGMPEQAFTAANLSPPFAHTAIATTVTETYLWIPGQFSSIPVGDPIPGKAYFVKAGGIVSTTGTPTVVNTFRYHGATNTTVGGVSLGASVAGTTGSGLANVPFYADAIMVFRTLGLAATSATVSASGNTVVGGIAGATPSLSLAYGVATATVDTYTQANMGLGIGWTWGTSSASNTVTAQWIVFGSYN